MLRYYQKDLRNLLGKKERLNSRLKEWLSLLKRAMRE